jgi:hypothetical protein
MGVLFASDAEEDGWSGYCNLHSCYTVDCLLALGREVHS